MEKSHQLRAVMKGWKQFYTITEVKVSIYLCKRSKINTPVQSKETTREKKTEELRTERFTGTIN